MKKFDIGQSIQVIANLGVIAGIIFLALEMRQSNDQMAAQTRFNNLQVGMAITSQIIADGELADALANALNGGESTPGERLRLRQLLILLLNAWEYEFQEYVDGRRTLEDLKIEGKRLEYRAIFGLAPDLWDSYKIGAPEAFVAFIENEIRQ